MRSLAEQSSMIAVTVEGCVAEGVVLDDWRQGVVLPIAVVEVEIG